MNNRYLDIVLFLSTKKKKTNDLKNNNLITYEVTYE